MKLKEDAGISCSKFQIGLAFLLICQSIDFVHKTPKNHNVHRLCQKPAKPEETFQSSDNYKSSNDKLKVVIPESLDPEYGMYTWPCAPVLAQYIWFNREWICGKSVLELGAGTALPGIVAAKCGASVHLSDSAALPKCRESCVKSCNANGLKDIQIHGFTWGRFSKGMFQLPKLDVIFASDCFYDTKYFEDIIVTVSFLLERNEGSQFYFTYQERSSARTIEHLLNKWNLTAKQILLSDFDADHPCLAGSDQPGNHTVHLFRLIHEE